MPSDKTATNARHATFTAKGRRRVVQMQGHGVSVHVSRCVLCCGCPTLSRVTPMNRFSTKNAPIIMKTTKNKMTMGLWFHTGCLLIPVASTALGTRSKRPGRTGQRGQKERSASTLPHLHLQPDIEGQLSGPRAHVSLFTSLLRSPPTPRVAPTALHSHERAVHLTIMSTTSCFQCYTGGLAPAHWNMMVLT